MLFVSSEVETKIKWSVGGKAQRRWVATMEEQPKGDEHMWEENEDLMTSWRQQISAKD